MLKMADLMAWGVNEGNSLVVFARLNLAGVGSNGLGDAASLSCCNLGLPNEVQQRGLQNEKSISHYLPSQCEKALVACRSNA